MSGPQMEYPFKSTMSIEKEMQAVIESLHSDPFLWYVGQLVKYTMRYSDAMQEIIDDVMEQLGLESVVLVVEIHIRRTDEPTEAKSHHEIHEYMKVAESYLNITSHNDPSPRIIYVASEDHTILKSVPSIQIHLKGGMETH